VISEYDPDGMLVRQLQLYGTQQLAWTWDYDDDFHEVSAVSPSGAPTARDYDDRGRIVLETDPDGVVTETEYSDAGDVLAVRVAGALVTSSVYDAQGNLLQSLSPSGVVLRENTYTSWGGIAGWEDADGQLGGVLYDAADRVRGLVVNGEAVEFTLDDFGRATGMADDLGDRGVVTHDGRGELVEHTDATGHVQRWTYDDRGFLVEQEDKAGRSSLFDYSDDGTLLRETTRAGDVIDYAYDAAGRVAQIDGGDVLVDYTYDPLGRVIRVENDVAIVEYTYDSDGNVATETTQPVVPGTLPTVTSTYTWSPAGRLDNVVLGAHGTRAFDHDSAGRVIQLDDSQTGTTQFSWGSDDLLTRVERVGGAVTELEYTAAQRPERRRSTNSSGSLLEDLVVERDALGRVVARTDSFGQHDYSYDERGQLVTATHPSSSGLVDEAYVYDDDGNRQSWTGHPAAEVAVDSADRLLQDHDYAYTYDHEGRIETKVDRTTLARTTYEWDSFDQLQRLVHADGTETTFAYDGLGRRVEVVDRGTVTRFVYDGDEIRMVFDGTNSPLAWLSTDDAGRLLAEWDAGTGTVSDALTDTIGSRVAWASGGGVQRDPRDAFGNPVSVSAEVEPHALTWHAQDPTGLIHALGRYLDPVTGRFLSEDPVDSSNRYVYAGNDPLTRWDPQGAASMIEHKLLRRGIERPTERGATITGIRLACVFFELASIVALIEPTPVEIVLEGACSAVSGRGGKCFPAGTRVAMAGGEAAIEDIEPGDLVLSRGASGGGWTAPAPAGSRPAFDRELAFVAYVDLDVHPMPTGDDLVLTQDGTKSLLRDLGHHEQFAYGGRVFELRRGEGSLEIRDTGDRVGRVESVYRRRSAELVDATFLLPDGTSGTVSATPDHSFYVPEHRGYIDLMDIDIGTMVEMEGGERASVVDKAVRYGDFVVYNIEVPGFHNYFVRHTPDSSGILTHNARYGAPKWSDWVRRPRNLSCQAHVNLCLGTTMAGLPGEHVGASRCAACLWACRRSGGNWPYRAPLGTSPRASCEYWRLF
jgi:RHS repeat-associated protein